MNRLNRFLHTRNFAVLILLIAAAMTYVAYRLGHVTDISGSRGTLFPSPNQWLPLGEISLVVSLSLMALTALCLTTLNKVFNVMRAPSVLASSLYILMLSSLPVAAGQFYGGTLMALLMLCVTALMFSCYGNHSSGQRVFMIFFILSLASLAQYAFMFYIPVALLGLVQMRIFNLRSIIATIAGIICPVWILYGFGLMELSDIQWPVFESSLSFLSWPDIIVVIASAGITVVLGFAAMCANLMKIFSYNAKFRALNGFLTLLLLSTIILMIVDYVNLSVYIPTLCLTAAYQVSHYFSIRRPRGAAWIMLTIILLYFAVYSTCYFL